jgi:hypothetical protein
VIGARGAVATWLGPSLVVALAMGCRHVPPPPPPSVAHRLPMPTVTPGELDPSALFGDAPARALRLGAGPVAIVASGEMVEGERLGAFVDLPPDACVLAYARASSSIEDIDLAAFDDDGSPVAVDEAPDPKPTVLLCPPHPPRVYVAAHVANGEGLVGVAAHLVPRDRAGDVARALGAHAALAEGPRPADGWPGLDDRVRAHRDALGGVWEEIRKVAVVLDSRAPTVVSFPVQADECADVVVVPGDEVALLEVEAQDDAGRVVGRAREGGPDRAITLCSPITMNGALVLRPHVGRGLAAVVLSRTRASSARDFTSKPDILWTPQSISVDAAKVERDEALAHAGYAAPTLVTKGTLAVGRRASIPLDVAGAPGAGAPGAGAPGTCTRVDVVGGAPLALVEGRAWSEKGELVASGEGAWGAVLFACPRGDGAQARGARAKVRLDLEARARGGPFAVEVRPERWRDAAFAARPLAAARMLARASEGPASLLEGSPSSVRAITLEPDRLVAWTEDVRASECARVSVGAEGEGTGLDLRAVDAAGEEIDRSHAERAVSARACAPSSGPLSVRWELRATSGKLEAVVGERVR